MEKTPLLFRHLHCVWEQTNASLRVKLTICSQSLEQLRRGSLCSAVINKIAHFCVLNRRVQATCGRVCTIGVCKPALRATEVNNLRTGKGMQTLEPIWPGSSLQVRPFLPTKNSTFHLFKPFITKEIHFSPALLPRLSSGVPNAAITSLSVAPFPCRGAKISPGCLDSFWPV